MSEDGRPMGPCAECGAPRVDCTGPDWCCDDCLHFEADPEGDVPKDCTCGHEGLSRKWHADTCGDCEVEQQAEIMARVHPDHWRFVSRVLSELTRRKDPS